MFKVWYKVNGHWIVFNVYNDFYSAVLNLKSLNAMGYETRNK